MSRITIDELEMLNPYELGKLLLYEVCKDSPDFQHIQDLLYVGCPIDIGNEENRTALHLAARWGHLEVVKFLVSNGARVDIKDCMGWTVLHYAANYGKFKVLEYLISIGAQVDIRDNMGRTAWDGAGTINRKALPELEPK